MHGGLPPITWDQLNKLLHAEPGSRSLLRDVELPPNLKCSGRLRDADVIGVVSRGTFISGGILRAGNILRCSFSRCAFDQLDLRRVHVDACACDNVDFSGQGHARIDKCVFRSCKFVDTTFKGVSSRFTTFSNCTFSGGSWADMRWDRCTFDNVVMTGRLVSSNFKGCTFLKCDMRNATLSDTSFLGSMTGLSLPDRRDNFVLAPSKLSEACRLLTGKLTEKKGLHGLHAWPIFSAGRRI